MFDMFHAHTFYLPIFLAGTTDSETIVLNFWGEKMEVRAQFPLCVIPLPRYWPRHTLIVLSASLCVYAIQRARQKHNETSANWQTHIKQKERSHKRLLLCKLHRILESWLRDAVYCSNILIKSVEFSCSIEKSLSWWNSSFWGWSLCLPGISDTGCDAQPLPAEFSSPRPSPSTLFYLVALWVQGNTT